jgi:hypothetical protein
MNLNSFSLAEFMQDVSAAGVKIMIKIDHERARARGKPWTVLLAAPQLGGSGIVHWDLRTLEECIRVVVARLQELPGDWDLLGLYVEAE